MTRSFAPAKAFALDLEAAVGLREASYARQMDEELLADGGRIIYAIDSAILNHLFLEKELSKDSRVPAGARTGAKPANESYQIFRGPKPRAEVDQSPDNPTPDASAALVNAQARLRRVLLWYILEGGSPGGDAGFENLILLPGHVLEVRNLYDGIVSQFERQRQRLVSLKEQAGAIAELAQEAEGGVVAAQEKRLALMKVLSEIATSISDPHDKFDRINSLINRRQIMSLRAAAQDAAFARDELISENGHIFEVEGTALRDEDTDVEGSWTWWNSELHGRLPARFAPLDRDALSTLDRINRRLDPQRNRMILFTDNMAIIEAGHLYFPFKRRDDGLQHLSFSDLYLRHPNSLLVDPKFFRPGADVGSAETVAASEVEGWLGPLLDETLIEPRAEQGVGEAAPPDGPQATLDRWLSFRAALPDLSERIGDSDHLERVLARNPTLHERFTNRWAEYLNNLHFQYQLNSPVASDKLAEITKLYDPSTAEDVDEFLKDIKNHLNFLTEKSWTTFFNTVADTGLELIALPSLDAQPAVWPVPVLFVQGDALLCSVLRSFWRPTSLRQNPSEILRRLNDPTFQATLPRSYVYALCYGLLFAHAERWPLTRLLAQRALRISRQLKKELGNDYLAVEDSIDSNGNVRVSGREASYLLAVSTRVNAQDSEEYSDARQALQVSIDSPDDFAEDGVAAGAKVTGIRFEAESIAICMAELLARPEIPDVADVQPLRVRIAEALESADMCGEELVRTHAQIALRSEFFLSLQFDIPTRVEDPIDAELVSKLPSLIEAQISDIEFVYGDKIRSGLEAAPLRDRALLRLAATFAGNPSLLPSWMLTTTMLQDRHDPVSGMRPINRRQLAGVERQVSRLDAFTG
jgi:hypothetical protein